MIKGWSGVTMRRTGAGSGCACAQDCGILSVDFSAVPGAQRDVCGDVCPERKAEEGAKTGGGNRKEVVK